MLTRKEVRMRPLEEQEILRVLRKHPGIRQNMVVSYVPSGCRFDAALALPRMIVRKDFAVVEGRCFASSLATAKRLAKAS